MEHIVQFAVSVDDDRITALAEKAAADELVAQIKGRGATYGFAPTWKDRIERAVVDRLVEEIQRDAVAEAAAEKLAGKLSRSQKFREKIAAELAERGRL